MTNDELKQLLEQNNAALFEQLGQRLEAKLDERLEQNNAVLFGQLARHFDKVLENRISPVESKVERIQATLDSIVKRLETDEQERAAIGHRLDRQDDWIGQLAQSTNTKFVPEQ